MNNRRDVIIGAGVMGLFIAYYLKKQGREVVVIDSTKADNNCSFGNAGYISPSHFIPLATPGIVWQGLKWMLDNTSPFYIKPRLDKSLFTWAYLFWKKANNRTIEENAPHLFQLLALSRTLTLDVHKEIGQNFGLWKDGCLMLYTTKSTGRHEKELARQAKNDFGLDVPVLDQEQLRQLDPLISKKVLGGTYYKIDCHLHPAEMMSALKTNLVNQGVQFVLDENITSFETSNGKVIQVCGNHQSFHADNVIIAAGSWSANICQKLGIRLPLQPGKGYSHTYRQPENNIKLPAILVDHRVAMTPFRNDLRVAGTMEMGGLNLEVSPHRIPPMINAANYYFDDLNLSIPAVDQVWAGLRPVSPDGLPYIGRDKNYQNVYVACGHAMIGISSAAATGLLISQMVSGQQTEIPTHAFRVNRF